MVHFFGLGGNPLKNLKKTPKCTWRPPKLKSWLFDSVGLKWKFRSLPMRGLFIEYFSLRKFIEYFVWWKNWLARVGKQKKNTTWRTTWTFQISEGLVWTLMMTFLHMWRTHFLTLGISKLWQKLISKRSRFHKQKIWCILHMSKMVIFHTKILFVVPFP